MDLLERRRKMMCVSGNELIPYIRGGSGSYIDTGIIPDATTKIIVWARNFNPIGGGNNRLFGSWNGETSSAFYMYTSMGTRINNIAYCYANSGYKYTGEKLDCLCSYHKYEFSKDGLYVDDVRITTISSSSASMSSNYSLYLFALNNQGTSNSSLGLIDICACDIYKGTTLVRSFTPVKSPNLGFYDSVSGEVFTNAGTSSFTYGQFDPNAYIPLQYIECTNAQYIDSNIYGTPTLPVVFRFKTIGTSVSYPDVFGTMVKEGSNGVDGTYFLLELGSATYKNRYATFYLGGSTTYQIYNNNSTKLTNQEVTLLKDATTVKFIKGGANFGTSKTFTVSSNFVTPHTLYIGGRNTYIDDVWTTGSLFNGYIYYAGFGTAANFVPAKSNGVQGMYDTYNDIFYPSNTNTPFIGNVYMKAKTEQIGNYQLIRYWDSEDAPSNNLWYDRMYNQRWTLTSSNYTNGYYEFSNNSTNSATSYATLGSLSSLGSHWKVVVDGAIKYNSSSNQYMLDFGSVQTINDGKQAFCIGLTSNRRWTFNCKFNGNSSASTYNPSTTNLQEDVSNGDWVRRTITIGVRASETEGMDETFAEIEGLGTGVSSPFEPITFNNWMTGYYIGRSAITPASSYPYASNVRIYSIKIYKETT